MSVAALEVCAAGPPEGEGADVTRSRPTELSVAGASGGGREQATPLRVLLVEDEPSMRMLCSFNLELAGFDVESVETGAEGVARAADGPYDLVLLDVMLPDLGGFEVAQRLQEVHGTEDVPVVFLSARGSDADRARGRAAGAIDYVVKPFDPVALPQRLREDLAELRRSGADAVRRLRFGSGDRDS